MNTSDTIIQLIMDGYDWGGGRLGGASAPGGAYFYIIYGRL